MDMKATSFGGDDGGAPAANQISMVVVLSIPSIGLINWVKHVRTHGTREEEQDDPYPMTETAEVA